jgi:hypothetical protein
MGRLVQLKPRDISNSDELDGILPWVFPTCTGFPSQLTFLAFSLSNKATPARELRMTRLRITNQMIEWKTVWAGLRPLA